MKASFSTMFSLILAVLSTASLCQAVVGHAIVPSSLTADNPFDGGALGSCEVPTTTVCSIDYAVPTSIARLAAIIERGIMNDIVNVGVGPCREAFTTVMCNVRFPRCEQQLQGGSQYQQVALNSQNCSILSGVCAESTQSVLLPYCNGLLQRVLPLSEECRPVSEHAEVEEPLTFCTEEGFGNSRVTPWMFEYVRYADQLAIGILYTTRPCGVRFATFMCTFGGRCNEDGERIEFVNTHELCNDIAEW